jgi:rsbT co-antagonist protein RsbR
MKEQEKNSLAAIIRAHEPELLGRLGEGAGGDSTRRDQVHEAESRKLAKEFLAIVGRPSRADRATCAPKPGQGARAPHRAFRRARDAGLFPERNGDVRLLAQESRFSRGCGASSASDAEAQADRMWEATLLLDALGLFTTEMYQKSREQVIQRQQRELLELSTPVVELWEGVLALPLIGTLDSNRTQVVMESLLEKIVESGAALAIIDITGVPPWTRSSPSTR